MVCNETGKILPGQGPAVQVALVFGNVAQIFARTPGLAQGIPPRMTDSPRRQAERMEAGGHLATAMGKSGMAPGFTVVGAWVPRVSSFTRSLT